MGRRETGAVHPFVDGERTLTCPSDFVIDDDGTELRAITTGNVTGNTESRVYKKQFSRGRQD